MLLPRCYNIHNWWISSSDHKGSSHHKESLGETVNCMCSMYAVNLVLCPTWGAASRFFACEPEFEIGCVCVWVQINVVFDQANKARERAVQDNADLPMLVPIRNGTRVVYACPQLRRLPWSVPGQNHMHGHGHGHGHGVFILATSSKEKWTTNATHNA